ncbi:Clp protease N-terminal domain-containing protein [Streptomyces sp. NPDC056437]|uniref:Clp protease N-terminal domain-containing protein n=1 Tax=Streptomyces sp. NPDC056437 TaxID=3345816 RepID=UPI00367B150F
MFERFTRDAREVVTHSVARAEKADADAVTEEHLLLALLDQQGTKAAFAFSALGVTDRRASVETALAEGRRRGGLSNADVEALAGFGVDVGEIVARVEEAHGPGALQASKRSKSWWSGHRPFTPAAKGVLVKSLRIATGRGDRVIGGEHLLLALTSGPGVVSEVLADHGVTYQSVERVLFPVRA